MHTTEYSAAVEDRGEVRGTKLILRTKGALTLFAAIAIAGCGGGGGGGDGGDDAGGGGGDDGGGGGGFGPLPPPEIVLEPLEAGDIVAMIETRQPSEDVYFLSATVPVQPETYTGEGGSSTTFGIVDWDGSVRPAQAEIVSRYPDASLGADVLELTAQMSRDPSVPEGQKVSFAVVVADQPVLTPPANPDVTMLASVSGWLAPEVEDLVTAPGSITLEAEDVFGNLYVLDLLAGEGGVKWQRFGHTVNELRLYGTMVPVEPDPGPTGTLPHLFGVHAYLRTWIQERVVGLDLRINNGADGWDKTTDIDDPLGRAYFESLNLRVPNGWLLQQSFADPAFGSPVVEGDTTVFPLVSAMDDGTLHVMPQNAQMHRRLVLSPIEDADRAAAFARQEGRGFSIDAVDPEDGKQLFSWWNPNTARYFPQSQQLPNLDHVGGSMDSQLDAELAWLSYHLENGTEDGGYPIVTGALGWAHPYGVSYGGMTGGAEIFLYDGIRTAAAASVSGYRMLQATHRMHTERQPNAYYGHDGVPTHFEKWLIEHPSGGEDYLDLVMYVSLHYSGNDPMGYDAVDTFQQQAVTAQGRHPDYELDLLGFMHHDAQHLIRYLRAPKALIWLGNDSLAKDDIRLQAELSHMTYTNVPNSPSGTKSGESMASDQAYVNAYPGFGFGFGRGEGWLIDSVNAYYPVADLAWRDARRPWYDDLVDLATEGQATCSGFYQSKVAFKMLEGKYRARTSISQAILESALLGVLESVYRGVDPTRVAMLEDSLVASYYTWTSEMTWQPGLSAPFFITAVGPADLTQPPFCEISLAPDQHDYNFDKYQLWSSLGHAYKLTGDPEFLNRASILSGGGDPLTALLSSGVKNIYNQMVLLTVLQNL